MADHKEVEAPQVLSHLSPCLHVEIVIQLIDFIETDRNLKVATTNYDTVPLAGGDKPFFTPTFVLPLRRGRIYWGNFKYLWLGL